MTQYNTVNVKLSNSRLSKLKSGIKTSTEETADISWNALGESNDNINFPHKLVLTNTHVSSICEALANGSSVNIKFSKTQ